MSRMMLKQKDNKILAKKEYSILFIFTLCSFFTPVLTKDFSQSLSDGKFPLVSRTYLSILADFKSAMVWMVPILPLISSSPSLFYKPLRIVPNAPATIGITFIFLFNCFLVLLWDQRISFFFFFVFFPFHSVFHWNDKIHSIICSFLLVG